MTFNLAQSYAQFLSRLCIKYNNYLQCILNDKAKDLGQSPIQSAQTLTACG